MIKNILKLVLKIIFKVISKLGMLLFSLTTVLLGFLYEFIVNQFHNFMSNRKTYSIGRDGNVSSVSVKDAIREDNEMDIMDGLDDLMDEIIERDTDPEAFENNQKMEKAKIVYNKEMIDNQRKSEGFEIL